MKLVCCFLIVIILGANDIFSYSCTICNKIECYQERCDQKCKKYDGNMVGQSVKMERFIGRIYFVSNCICNYLYDYIF